jgi:hypothetical protein
MAAVPSDAQLHHRAHAEVETRGHGHETSHGDDSPGSHEQSPQPFPEYCPHCHTAQAMPNHASSSAHAFCSAFNDVSDQSSSSVPTFAKHIFLVAAFETLPPLAFHPPPRHITRKIDPTRGAVALNLRHCVFLI